MVCRLACTPFRELLFRALPIRPADLSTIGYDRQTIQYSERVLVADNDSVRNSIRRAGREVVESFGGKEDDGDSVDKPFVVDPSRNDSKVVGCVNYNFSRNSSYT